MDRIEVKREEGIISFIGISSPTEGISKDFSYLINNFAKSFEEN